MKEGIPSQNPQGTIEHRGFFKRLLSPKGLEKKASMPVDTDPDEGESAVMGRRAFIKGAAAVTAVVATGALEGCGSMLDSTPEGDWFNEPREMFPEHKITFDAEIEKTFSPEGRDNVVKIISEKFMYVPKAFWEQITEVRVEKYNSEKGLKDKDDKIIRIPAAVLGDREFDAQLIINDNTVIEEVVRQIGLNWYSRLSDTAQILMESFSPKGSDPKLGLGQGFKFFLLFPETITLMRTYAKKYNLSDALGQLEDAYAELRDNVFAGHSFQGPFPKLESNFTRTMLATQLPGYKDTDENWKIFLQSLRDEVDKPTQAFIDYSLARTTFYDSHDDNYSNKTWNIFLAAQQLALEKAQSLGSKPLENVSRMLKVEAYAMKTSVSLNNDPIRRLYVDMAIELFNETEDVKIKRSLASMIANELVTTDVDPTERCLWVKKNKDLNQGTVFNVLMPSWMEACPT